MSRYLPGQAFSPNLSTPNFLKSKRKLSADEFQFYYNYLNSDKINEAQKAGLAVVLLADTARLFGVYRDYFVDPVLKGYVDKYQSFDKSSTQYAQAKAEVTKFDLFLAFSQLPADSPADKAVQTRLSYAQIMGSHKRKEEQEQKVVDLLKSEQNKMVSDKEIEATKKNSLIAAQAIETHMITKIREYLSALYNENAGRYFMDAKLSKIEHEIRLYLIDLVQDKRENPVKAMNAYNAFLNDLPNTPSIAKAKSIIRDYLGYYEHPLMARLK